MRAQLYTLLAQMLARPPRAPLLARIAMLDGTDSPLGRALAELAARAAATREDEARREYEALFIGLERGELVPYASYYLTGFLHDRPLARLREDMRALGLERIPGVAEPEDHIATICEIMAGILARELDAAPDAEQARFFRRHLAPWAGRFFADLERARAAALYRPVGTIGRQFMELEEDAWAAAAPPGSGQVRPDVVRLQDGGRYQP
ncbi:MAG TPA: molecular chaperone TorD family protein [Geminicoccaceae bacterium]|nr:molecular chaperone TorD family protein [Geminicoccaceae bacterium]